MNGIRSAYAILVLAVGFGVIPITDAARAQNAPPSAPYNPYPQGILPSDLDAEIERVRGEVRAIFEETLKEARALGPISRAGNPPTIAGRGYAALKVLGDLMNFDESISVAGNQACSFCHMPYTGFSGPIPSVNLSMAAYPGSFQFRGADRTPMRYTYAARFPVLWYNEVQGDFFGGNFWDGRATGHQLQNANAEQATDPPVSAEEMGFPDTACIPYRLGQTEYVWLFEAVWGVGLLDIEWPDNTEEICSTPAGAARFGDDATPLPLTPEQRAKADGAYRIWGQSVSFYQSSGDVSPFTSKFDAHLAHLGDPENNPAVLTDEELAGYELFRGKGQCTTCHLDGAPNATEPLFTDTTYVNLGLPLNPRIPFYYETTPDPHGFTVNPHGFGFRDLGVGSFLRSVKGVNPNDDWRDLAPEFDGKFQVMTARNTAMTPTQCPTTEAGKVDDQGNPIPYFQKSFFHNGYIKSLKQLVHFYNTRDVHAYDVTSGHCPEGTTERVDCWPKPEVPNNMDDTIGDLGLTDQEEDLIVAFLETLTDGYTTPYPNRDIYAGTCQTGGSAATQGNETLIPTPDLPTCPSSICGVAPLPQPPIP
ncbi:MAG: cytochrome c peroxidase [Pseudomonadota bacterium]